METRTAVGLKQQIFLLIYTELFDEINRIEKSRTDNQVAGK